MASAAAKGWRLLSPASEKRGTVDDQAVGTDPSSNAICPASQTPPLPHPSMFPNQMQQTNSQVRHALAGLLWTIFVAYNVGQVAEKIRKLFLAKNTIVSEMLHSLTVPLPHLSNPLLL